MESARFDDAVKLLARAVPRRGALAVVALSGWGLARLDSANAKKKNKKTCRKACIAPQAKCTERRRTWAA